ncbi:MAG: leucine-rich repeat protein [Bacilli bacterium]|nr:leucine-rich repeat protein [Bacilli bacterium]
MKKSFTLLPLTFLLSSCLCGWGGPLPGPFEDSSSSESISVDPYTSPVTDIPHGKPTYDKLNFAEDKEGGGILVRAASTDISGEVVIPTTYGPHAVTGISFRGFSECNNITSIYIPKGVMRIYVEGIKSCENLETVFIPETIDSVTVGNFLSCPKLRVIVSDKSEHYSSLDGALYDKAKTEIL